MVDRLDLYFRAHTIPVNAQAEESWTGRHQSEPDQALIFRCVTTTDEKQELLFGAYICAQRIDAGFVAREIGLFHRPGHREEMRVLKRFVKDSAFEIGTVEEFRCKIFLKYLKGGALIVAYRQRNDRFNQNRRMGSVRGRFAHTQELPSAERQRCDPGIVLR